MTRFIISYLVVIFLFNNSSNCYAIEEGLNKNEDYIILGQKSFSEDGILQIDSIPCKINIFKLNKFNEPAFSNIDSDTIPFNISKANNKNIIKDDGFIEIRWKVYVDSSFQNEMIGIEFNRFDYTKIFWDNKLIVDQGNIDDLRNISQPNKFNINVYPINTGIGGWHDLVIRQKHKNNMFKSGIIAAPLYYSLHQNYNVVIEKENENQNSIANIFFFKGFRFFLLGIFVTSFLFFLLVNKTKSFFWFSIFSLFSSIVGFVPDILITNNSDFYVYCCLTIFMVLIYSFVSFIFYNFFDKMPKRINWYFSIIIVVGLTLFIQEMYFKQNKFILEPFDNILLYSIVVLYVIIWIECLIKIIYALYLKKKRIEFIGWGILQYIIVIPISVIFFYADLSLLLISVYLIPISFLITLILIVKDSFSENISKQKELLALTQTNEKILIEQNETLEQKVIERTIELVEQKQRVEEQKHEITDSIQYAQRIQFAILPTKENILKAFPQSFILFKPKDIVSGDFYWFQEVENKKYIAACDCTGHGVPGALMSMVATDMLNDALVHSKKVDEILALTNRSIKTALKQNNDDDSTRDGMDLALCCFDDQTNILKYAGAYRPLWLIRHAELDSASSTNAHDTDFKSSQNVKTVGKIAAQGRNDAWELIEYKATKAAIGGLTEDNQIFQLNEIQLQKGDTIYLSSDGYADQFSPADKKLMTKRFKEILLSIQHLSMPEQEKYLEKFITNWRGSMEQTDDVLVIGVRV